TRPLTRSLAAWRKHGRSRRTDHEAEHVQPRPQGPAAARQGAAAPHARRGAEAQAARGPQPGRGAGGDLPGQRPGIAVRAGQAARVGAFPARARDAEGPASRGLRASAWRRDQPLTAATARATYSRLPWLSAATQMRPVPTA